MSRFLDAPAAARLLVALALGIGIGLLSSAGDGSTVRVFVALANAASPWLIVAFAAGALQRSRTAAAWAGGLALVAAVAVYYGRILLVQQLGFPITLAAAWLVIALVAGPLAGLAGAEWRSGGRWRVLAVGALSGVILAEASLQIVRLEAWDGFDLARTQAQLAVANAVIGVVLIGLLLDVRRWGVGAGAALLIGVAGLGALLGLEVLFLEVLIPLGVARSG